MDKREQLAKLSILPVNKTVVFYSPVEGKNVLVRTGTIGDGSCCYHATLHAYSKEYVGMNEKERRKFVTKLRSSLASKVDRSRWEEISGGLVAKIPFQENINKLLHDFYRHIEKGRDGRSKNVRKVIRNVIKNDQDRETFQLIAEMVPLHDFEKRILPDVYDTCADDSIQKCKDSLVSESERYYNKVFSRMDGNIDSRRVDFCVRKLGSLIESIATEAESMAFTDYIANLKDVSVVVDRYTIGLISNRFNRDIYFIDSRTRMPYREGGVDHLKNRKSIILMWTGGVHYEVVGKLLPGNRIQREFKPEDPLIKRINTYLCHPERIPEEYPNLVPYLPKEQRDNIGFSSRNRSGSYSDSQSDSGSESGSDYEASSVESDYEESSHSEKNDSLSGSEEDEESDSHSPNISKSPSPSDILGKSPSPQRKQSPSPKEPRRERREKRESRREPRESRREREEPRREKHREKRKEREEPRKEKHREKPRESRREREEPRKEKHREKPRESRREREEPRKEKHREKRKEREEPRKEKHRDRRTRSPRESRHRRHRSRDRDRRHK